MAIYRVVSPDGNKITVIMDGARYYLDPSRPYDSKKPQDNELIERFPGHFAAENVEDASAAPGRKRSASRPA